MKFAVGKSLRHADHQSVGETAFKFRSSAWRPLAAPTAPVAPTGPDASGGRRVGGPQVRNPAPGNTQTSTDHNSAPRPTPRNAERGVALVITLILLSVITFMAIAFLVLSTNQRSAVTTTTDQIIARNGADTAQTRAVADMLAWMLVTTNPYGFTSPRVSTNYLSYYFTNGISSPLNVNFDFNNSGAPLTLDQQRQNLTNLLLNPRPPVWITNAVTGSNEFRFYVDLNRNGRFEPTGLMPATNSQNGLIPGPLSYFVGDPQWIGALEFPDKTHSANNFFTYRYAYIILPASQSLDLNYIHNYAKNLNPNMTLGADGFLRNQGVATWEINLAAFLADLNTNVWLFTTNGGNPNPYTYNCDLLNYTRPNTGYAFEDALSLLRYRYANNLSTLAPASATLFGGALGTAQRVLGHNYIDDYSAGPPMTGTWWMTGQPNDADSTRVGNPWAGSENTNHYYTSQELFDPTKIPGNFAAHLQQAGRGASSYDRYTFYRLLSALGTDTDSASDLAKINLNYDNLVQTNAQGIASATNFFEWRPIDFFTNTANALLANAGYKFTVTNIQVWPTNFYTPSVHRLLQLAANIYDSTTNRSFNGAGYPFLPTVFRPIYRRTTIGTNTVVLIHGYREVIGTTIVAAGTGSQDVELDTGTNNVNFIPPLGTAPGPDRTEPLVSGFPLVVGAKAGLPNFNEFSSQGYVFMSRLLEFRRTTTGGPVTSTNQMYVASITNTFGLETWNSYSNIYRRNIQMIVRADMTAIVTNELGRVLVNNRITQATNTVLGPWPGWTNANAMQTSFVLPWSTNGNCTFLTNATYDGVTHTFIPLTHVFPAATRNVFEIPHWFLNLNTRVRCILVDQTAQRIVDYVDLNYWQPTMDLTAILTQGSDCNPINYNNIGNQFCITRQHGAAPPNTAVPTLGLLSQIAAGEAVNGDPDMRSFNLDPYAGLDAHAAIDGFRVNMGFSPLYPEDQSKTFYKSNVFYAPLAPYRPVYVHTTWQVNDPLVHYLVNDLDPTYASNRVDFNTDNPPLWNIGQINKRYQPWGGGPGGSSNPTIPDYDFAAKDPGVARSDAWEFPTNKYANIGWLGRVHRGTPWQTVFLKYTNIMLRAGPVVNGLPKGLRDWQQWSGNQLAVLNVGQFDTNVVGMTNFYTDAILSMPTNDWRILDLFSTTFNANGARGRLSVNQTNLAAWSAILSGVNVMPDVTTNKFIPVAGPYGTNYLQPGVVSIVTGIINARTNFPNYSYQRLGDVLATPDLTVASPFLTGDPHLMNDEVVERIPQQILGLLKGNEQPRFVIYAFGQALKPAPQSIIPGGPYLGVCTNYQITAEVATRTVVRIDDALPVTGRPYKPHAVIENFNVLPPD